MEQEFSQQLQQGWQGDCPCCGRFAKVYRRRIHVSVALQLIQLYKMGGHDRYIHVSKMIARGVSGPADFSKAKYWGLIAEKPKVGDKAENASGYWRLTDRGVEFVLGQLRLDKFALVYDDKVLATDGGLVSIRECLRDKFNYEELMEAVRL